MTRIQLRAGRFLARGAGMPPRLLLGMALAIALLSPASFARAGVVNINFETAPFPTAAQPNNFIAAGAMQTYVEPGIFNISGGVVLGNPTFLPEFAANGSLPNLYGTADFADPSLLQTITLNLDPSQLVTKVTGLLFNGQNSVLLGNTESYDVIAFSGTTLVDEKTFDLSTVLTDPASFTTFNLFSSLALPITQVTFTPPDAAVNGWDFLVDSIQATSIPEPSTFGMGGTALLFGLAYAWRRRRQDTLDELA
jgi:hypothetical protein